ncbi:MAG TPA: deoxyribodipyrimidine photo-lyase [Devosia sp.]|jgi:deoxyribodipyrimidine photo-lyase|uniref:cryptochrome/photolyase family protein n=1 Tax=Devosia sp. TaxID=1871048 RepID=UPI002DDCEBA3|nr:deoxyribodipyrimidine photo-lyase [Devosia sp.]HEV2517684.1 deoxyribodipyrimidine photo-lyase [Devosia sp.]
MTRTALVWLRNDLRTADNPALHAALQYGKVRAIHIEATDGKLRRRGAASRWWLHHSLNRLALDLAQLGVALETIEGETEATLLQAVAANGVDAVYWNRRYGPAEREIDAGVKARLKREGVAAESFAANLLIEPFEMATGTGKPYSVYTPFWNALKQRDIAKPLPTPPHGQAIEPTRVDTSYREADWGKKLGKHWQIGEAAARERLDRFLDELVLDYPEDRDIPARAATSGLSPHLAFGEISPRQVWHAAQAVAQHAPGKASAIDKFLSELGWRDFNYNQLYHRQDIATVPMVAKYAELQWRRDDAALTAWQQGRTGIPIIDAGMRELWDTGVMHNRVRMLTASLLAKNLLIDWRQGEQWFWDTLVDADPANNPGNWQWVAGSGLDASPYFRIFNPVTQGERFDPAGNYVRRWVPEVAGLPDKLVHQPWQAPDATKLAYPKPIVDLKLSRERALEAFKAL